MEPEETSGAEATALRDAAEVLAGRLKSGAVARALRPAARQALARAFATLDAGAGDAALLWELDALAFPFVPAIPAAPRLRGLRLLTGASEVLVERAFSYLGLADRLVGRIDRFLAVLDGEPLKLFVREVKPGEGDRALLDLTEG